LGKLRLKQKYFDLAKKLSFKSDHRCKLGCVIIKKSKILGVGFNKLKTSPRSTHPYQMIHAELDAILNVSDTNDLVNSELYIYRQTKDGILANSFPCVYCQYLLKNFKIKTVYYTTPNKYEVKLLED